MNILTRADPSLQITEHARLRASDRDVSLKELSRVFSDPRFVEKNSKRDPESRRYVLRYKNLRIVWELVGNVITVLGIFAK